MSFTFNTSTNIGRVRALVQDTVEASAVLSDEEIQVYLDIASGDVLEAASMAAFAISAAKAATAKSISAGNYKEDFRDQAKWYQSLGKMLSDKAKSVPAEAQAEEILTDFNYNQILQSKSLRNELPDS